jgi:polyhydroxyalkanoate synthase
VAGRSIASARRCCCKYRRACRAVKSIRGKHEFVLSTSGHVQSVVRPPHIANTEYFTNSRLPDTPEEWLASATRQDGSWWPHWAQWLRGKSGSLKAAPAGLGSARYPVLMAAPGTYVLERA